MAQYKAFSPKVLVNGQTMLATVNAFPGYMQERMKQFLAEKGVTTIESDGWYSQVAWLETMQMISEEYGPNTLFTIGKAIPENAVFPPEIDSIEKALSSIDVAYQMNHRDGEIGYYKVVSHDEGAKVFKMCCRNPYPCDFDRGIITTMARKFKTGVKVNLDKTQKGRNNGADESWYIISYL